MISKKRLEWCTKFHATISKRYTLVKQGDSWETQKAEKISDKNFNSRSNCRASTNEHHKSAITDHVCQNNHIMNWEASEIVEQESDKFKRWIKESICIRSNTPTMNRDEGAYQLSPIWTQVISTPKPGGRGRLQSDFARLSQ